MSHMLPTIHKKTLSGSIFFALFLHGMALYFLKSTSLWLSPVAAHPDAPWLSLMEKKKKGEILKEAFQKAGGEATVEAKEREVQPEGIHYPPLYLSMEPFASPTPATPSLSFLPMAAPLELFRPPLPFLPSFSLPEPHFIPLLSHLPEGLIVPPEREPPEAPQPLAVSIPPTEALPLAVQKSEVEPQAWSEPRELPLSMTSEGRSPPPAPSPLPLPYLPKLPTLEELKTISCSDSFEAELTFSPLPDEEEGYLFALTLIPRPDLKLPKLHQHYLFLIDRSNSIQRERLNGTKQAVLRALKELDATDTFNIYAFDSKVEKLSPSFLSCTPQTMAQAEQFLSRLELGSFFSSTDLYKPLFLTVPGNVEGKELYTTLLFTDGEALQKKGAASALLSEWTLLNQGRVSLFPISLSHDPHLPLLDTLAALNKGKLISSSTQRGVKRRVLKLMKSIESPVAKNLSCHAIAPSKEQAISLFPDPSLTPHLYLGEPFVILGKTKNLDDFILFVQGKTEEGWLNIKKKISFLHAKKVGGGLLEEWEQQQAYHLEAKRLLGPQR